MFLNGTGRLNILDLISDTLSSPVSGVLSDSIDDVLVQLLSLFKQLVEV